MRQGVDGETLTFVLETLQSEGRPLDDVFSRRGGTVWEFKMMAAAARKILARIDMPTLICHARQDDQSDLSNAVTLMRGLRGPVETVVLDDCYHMVTLDRQRTQIVDRTVAFADRLSAAWDIDQRRAGEVRQSSVVPGPLTA